MPDRMIHPETGLMVYSTDEVAWNRDALLERVASGMSKVVRKATVSSGGIRELKDVLRTADAIFENLASSCGAIVVSHSWGLAQPPADEQVVREELSKESPFPVLPESYALVVEVDTVHQAQNPPREYRTRIGEAVNDHWRGTEKYMWSDCKPDQIIYGTTDSNGENLYIADIEPYLKDRDTIYEPVLGFVESYNNRLIAEMED